MNTVSNLLAAVLLVTLFCNTFSHPDVQRNENQDTPVGLHQIEEGTVDPNSQVNLKRSSRKVECPFAKLKSAKSSSSYRTPKCPFSSKQSSPEKSYKFINTCEESSDMSSFITLFGSIVEEIFIQVKTLMDIMPIALDNIKNQAILIPGLIEDVEITSNSCARTQKDLSGFFDFFGNIFKFSKPESDNYETEDVDVSGCLEKIKGHLMKFLGFLKPCMKSSGGVSVERISKIETLLEHLSPSKFKTLSPVCVSPPRIFKYPSLVHKHSGSSFGTCDESVSVTDQIYRLRELSTFMDQFPTIINEMMEAIRGVSQNHVQVKEVYPIPPSHSTLDYSHRASYKPCSTKPGSTEVHTYYKRPTVDIVEPPRIYQIPARTPISSCTGQSIINEIAMKTASDGRNFNIDASSISNMDLSNTKVTLDRSTVKSMLYEDNLNAGDVIIINITNDIMLVGAPFDDVSPIMFNIVYRKVSNKSPYNYKTTIWNLASQDFSCNQQIFNDILSDLTVLSTY
ncbi:GSCOCG00009661001-RA-CDS [Cotesia congregata]|nr:GSCOCG00009661001-RA-CDS [Cotesia congregata]